MSKPEMRQSQFHSQSESYKTAGTPTDLVEAFEQMTAMTGKAQQMMLEFWAAQGFTDGWAKAFDAFAPLQNATPDASADTTGASTSTDARSKPESGTPAGLAAGAAIWSDMLADWSRAWGQADTGQMGKLVGNYWQDQMQLWTSVFTNTPETAPAPATKPDKRFKAEAWSSEPVYDLVRKSYLLASHYLLEGVGSFQGLTDAERKKLTFQTQQFVDAMSPSNFAALNPEVIARARETNGESLMVGLQHMLDDLQRGQLKMTDETAFEVGRNVAVTPGAVIYENELFQLIHYKPTTKQVHETPLLICPPWINKFYILDLTPEKSFIQWAVDQGFSVYLVSWAQASEAHRDYGIDHYVVAGELEAINQVLKASGAESTHVIGYCVAGTMLAAALAYMEATGQAHKVKSATFFTAQVDFSEAGDLGQLVAPNMLATLDSHMDQKGFLDGRYLAASFNLLRPTELLWNYVVNNYLKGQDYVPFDLLFWNSDCTHVPARFMREYLQGLYVENRLAQPGGLTIAGVPIDLGRVQTPVYVQAGWADHIAPRQSCYKLTKAFSGPVRFMLAGSGHIAGVVNPPAAQKYQYWRWPEERALPDSIDLFEAQADVVPGSWWPDWQAWVAARSGKMVPARVPGKAKGFPAIEPAPGRYVRERVA